MAVGVLTLFGFAECLIMSGSLCCSFVEYGRPAVSSLFAFRMAPEPTKWSHRGLHFRRMRFECLDLIFVKMRQLGYGLRIYSLSVVAFVVVWTLFRVLTLCRHCPCD